MLKDYYRNYIIAKKPYLNLSAICRAVGVNQPALSHFLKGSQFDMFMSIDNLRKICDFIENL